jgi:hypothetical protein
MTLFGLSHKDNQEPGNQHDTLARKSLDCIAVFSSSVHFLRSVSRAANERSTAASSACVRMSVRMSARCECESV